MHAVRRAALPGIFSRESIMRYINDFQRGSIQNRQQYLEILDTDVGNSQLSYQYEPPSRAPAPSRATLSVGRRSHGIAPFPRAAALTDNASFEAHRPFDVEGLAVTSRRESYSGAPLRTSNTGGVRLRQY